MKGEAGEDAKSPLKSEQRTSRSQIYAAEPHSPCLRGEVREQGACRHRVEATGQAGPARKPQKPLGSARKFSQLPPCPRELVYSQEPTARGRVTDPLVAKKWDPGQS